MTETTTEIMRVYEKNTTKDLPVVQRLENGYVVVQDATLTDGGTSLRNEDYCLVNPDGKILIHANDAESLIKYGSNPETLRKIEKNGSVA